MEIVIISHGEYSKGSVDAFNMITGMGSEVKYIQMKEDIEEFEKKIELISKNNECIFLADLVGGHPFNTSVKNILINKGNKQIVIGGYNLAILIEVVMILLNNNIEELDGKIEPYISNTMKKVKNF